MAEQVFQKRQSPSVIALDLGGTKLASCLFAADGQPQQRRITPLDQRHGKAVGELIANEVRRLRDEAAKLGAAATAVGVSVPGIVNHETGRVWAPNIPGWDDYPLQPQLEEALADDSGASPKVFIDNDRAAYILGEIWQGAARGCRDAIYLAVGTGIGAGILADGRVLRGAHGIAGAIGWLALDRPFRSEYRSCGCFETHASGEGLAKQLAAALASRPTYNGPLADKPRPTAYDLFAAYEAGDDLARELLDAAMEFWGMAVANLVSLFNPEKIIFGGGVFGPATQFFNAIYDEARGWAQPIAIQRVKFEPSQLGPDAGLYGAGFLALNLHDNAGHPERSEGSSATPDSSLRSERHERHRN